MLRGAFLPDFGRGDSGKRNCCHACNIDADVRAAPLVFVISRVQIENSNHKTIGYIKTLFILRTHDKYDIFKIYLIVKKI